MTFKQGSEIVLRKMAGGDVPNDFPVKEEEVYIVMQQIMPLIVKNDYFKTYTIEKRITDTTFFTTFTAQIQKPEHSKESYVVLPSAPNFLFGTTPPQVTWTADRFSAFVYVDAGQLHDLKQVGVIGELEGSIFTYEYVSDCDNEHRLVFFGIEDCQEEVRIRMIQSISMDNFDADSTIPIKKDLAYELLDETYKWFTGQGRETEDKITDNRKDRI